jgi:dTDP-4-dehydrorhamnose 3,5-epimerase
MKIETLPLSGLQVITPDVYEDERGFFMESYHQGKYTEAGIRSVFVQDSHSHSLPGVVRGIKFQFDEPTDKLVRVSSGEIFAVGVDLRPDSDTFGRYASVILSGENKKQLYLPFGFGFGFTACTEADVLYKLSALHNEAGSGTILWNDRDIAIAWPESAAHASAADAAAQTFAAWQAAGGAERMRADI